MKNRRPFASMFPSLEASMNFGQFGCAGLTPQAKAARVCAQPDAVHGGQKPDPARAKGFSAFLYERQDRV